MADVKFHCRQCGGDRNHTTYAKKHDTWDDPDSPVCGADTWSIVQCCGCDTVTFVHQHWFSEDIEFGDDGPTPKQHVELYPPSPPRKMPEWGSDIYLCFSSEQSWVANLHADIYTAIGIKLYSLAAMGIRTIIDFVITDKSKDDGNDFKEKLKKLSTDMVISDAQIDVIYTTFDAGSATAHRGYRPSVGDVYQMLDLAEYLLEYFYINPVKQSRHKRNADALMAKVPARKKKKT